MPSQKGQWGFVLFCVTTASVVSVTATQYLSQISLRTGGGRVLASDDVVVMVAVYEENNWLRWDKGMSALRVSAGEDENTQDQKILCYLPSGTDLFFIRDEPGAAVLEGSTLQISTPSRLKLWIPVGEN